MRPLTIALALTVLLASGAHAQQTAPAATPAAQPAAAPAAAAPAKGDPAPRREQVITSKGSHRGTG